MNMHLQGGVAVGAKPNAGIDVSKQHLDARVGTELRRVGNDQPGWDELTAMLLAAGVDLVVIEATHFRAWLEAHNSTAAGLAPGSGRAN